MTQLLRLTKSSEERKAKPKKKKHQKTTENDSNLNRVNGKVCSTIYHWINMLTKCKIIITMIPKAKENNNHFTAEMNNIGKWIKFWTRRTRWTRWTYYIIFAASDSMKSVYDILVCFYFDIILCWRMCANCGLRKTNSISKSNGE